MESFEYFWQHPSDIMNAEQMKPQKRSPNMPSLDNESPSGRYLAEDCTPQDGFAGTFLEGAHMFTERMEPNFVPPDELVREYAKYLEVDLSDPHEEGLYDMLKEGLMMPFQEEE
jgi:hypothetical protein